MVKQWIGHYRSRITASSKSLRAWARRRQLFFCALVRWPVAELVSVLPVVLHLALFIFVVGVVAFLWNLDRAIAVWLSVLCIILGVFYTACTLVPLWLLDCPTSTPLLAVIRRSCVELMMSVIRALIVLGAMWRRVRGVVEKMEGSLVRLREERNEVSAVSRLLALQANLLDTAALHWLIFDVSDDDSVAVALQAIGALHPDDSLTREVMNEKRFSSLSVESVYTRSTGDHSILETSRVMRAALCGRICANDLYHLYSVFCDINFIVPLGTSQPDALFIQIFYVESWTRGPVEWEQPRITSPTLTST